MAEFVSITLRPMISCDGSLVPERENHDLSDLSLVPHWKCAVRQDILWRPGGFGFWRAVCPSSACSKVTLSKPLHTHPICTLFPTVVLEHKSQPLWQSCGVHEVTVWVVRKLGGQKLLEACAQIPQDASCSTTAFNSTSKRSAQQRLHLVTVMAKLTVITKWKYKSYNWGYSFITIITDYIVLIISPIKWNYKSLYIDPKKNC